MTEERLLDELEYMLNELHRHAPKSWHKDRIYAQRIKLKEIIREVQSKRV